jgi:GntR family transcriptional regulator
MQLHIDPTDGVPIYIQVVNQVKRLVASGRLVAGEEIPPIRVLAQQLVVNPNTIARAYLELERAGIVTKRQGLGTYISETPLLLSQREKLRALTPRADALLVDAEQLGIGVEKVMELIRERHQSLQISSTR